jgi:RNA polymerase primary sigma factor
MRNSKYFKQLGQYGIDISKLEKINAATERKLSKKIKSGDIIARNMLVKSNLKLVLALAHQYTGNGVSFEDLVSGGNLGLITAADRFDGSKHNRFSTYAYWYIKEAMFSSMEDSNNYENMTTPLILEDRLLENSDILDVKNEEAIIFNYSGIKHDISGEGDDKEETNEVNENLFKTVTLHIDKLTKRESDIIKHYYGICECEELGLSDLSEKYNISKMRVSAIIETSLRKIRCGVMAEK